jgi:aminoglycoside/choline kinase family phosphotransferase
MTQQQIHSSLEGLFVSFFGYASEAVEALPRTASGRYYFRMHLDGQSVIGTYGKNVEENRAFLYFSKHFANAGVPVPTIMAESEDGLFYIQEDLGGTSLMDCNKALREGREDFPHELLDLYKKTIKELCKMQVKGAEGLDYSKCYASQAFDRQSMTWDLNYFKYYFLNLSDVSFDEGLLEKDFGKLVDYLLSEDTNFFLFRDFQSRNVMIRDDKPYFIDYQGGRQGALQYDLASLLYQSKADIPQHTRGVLLDYYIDCLEGYQTVDRVVFKQYFHAYLLVRLIQVLGAYGRRGLIEKMPYFIQSIPLGLRNVSWWLRQVELPIKIPYLRSVLKTLAESEEFKAYDKGKGENSPLLVRISSFSYKEGIPEDPSGNGGGFVFDCRNIHNPGRYLPYKKLTGRDKPVQDFLKTKSHWPSFMQQVCELVDAAVENYVERDFSSLMVSFGCTGGQHRSVFSADTLAKHLGDKYGVRTEVRHIVQERKNWVN